MTPGAKARQRIQRRLGALRANYRMGLCWICGSPSGTKTAREACGVRCVKCIHAGVSTADVDAYEALKASLEQINQRNL